MKNLSIDREYYNFVLLACQQVLFDYECQEIDCLSTFEEHPTNSKEDITEKVKILNSCYSTRVPNISMTENIALFTQDVDWDNVNTDIVGKIAHVTIEGKSFDYFSFATKYCAFCAPQRFPIFDSLVWAVFCQLNEEGYFSKDMQIHFRNVQKNKSNAYSSYIAIYESFIDLSGLRPHFNSYRHVDRFLWGLCEIALRCNNKKSKSATKKKHNLFAHVFPAIAEGVAANMIWQIILEIVKRIVFQ